MTDLHRHTGFDDRIDPALFDRYVTGTSTPEETAVVQRWASTPERQRLLSDAFAEDGGDLTERQARVWAFIVNAIRSATPASRARLRSALSRGQRTGTLGTQTLRRWVWPIAFGLAVSALVINLGHTGWASRDRNNATIAMTTYATNAGQRANITLPDGSHVLLNVASQLQVPVDFAHGDRMLLLSGEALFTVEHHASDPFTVVAAGTTARVLGTTFLVRRYTTDTATMVVVQTGKVAVRSLMLAAGRQVEVTRRGTTHVQPADTSQFSFASGVLTLDDVPLPTAIPELDRWYDVDIQLGSPSLTGLRIDGRLTAGSLTDLTALLALTFHVRVVRDGRVLTLFPG